MKLPEKIKAIRENKQLSKNQLAKLAGISQSYISDLEAGKKNPTIEVLEKICEALGITIIDLLKFPATSEDGLQELPPDLLQWLELGQDLSPEQRQALMHTIKILKS